MLKYLSPQSLNLSAKFQNIYSLDNFNAPLDLLFFNYWDSATLSRPIVEIVWSCCWFKLSTWHNTDSHFQDYSGQTRLWACLCRTVSVVDCYRRVWPTEGSPIAEQVIMNCVRKLANCGPACGSGSTLLQFLLQVPLWDHALTFLTRRRGWKWTLSSCKLLLVSLRMRSGSRFLQYSCNWEAARALSRPRGLSDGGLQLKLSV